MKRRTARRFALRACACCMLLACLCAQALAYDAKTAEDWLGQFAAALETLPLLHDPAQTVDPARAGQALLEYEFGTVLSGVIGRPSARDMLEIDVRTDQVTDCRGVRVGMEMEAALGGGVTAASGAPLCVLETQEAGYGWSWAYVGEDGVYGVEWITYGGDASGMREYTLTYVISDGLITAIRMKMADATLAQAQAGLETAEEIAARQDGEPLAARNQQPVFGEGDLQVMGRDALGVPVDVLVSVMGEPQEVQTLPQGGGRILLYEGAAVRLAFNEATGEELVRSVSVSSEAIEGPRRLTVGMPVREATAQFCCETDLYGRGGTLYLAGEAAGEAPYGELRIEGGALALRYACVTQSGETALLEAGVADGAIAYWSLTYARDAEGGV